MVTPLQLARVYATIGSYGVYRPLSITKVDPPVPGERIFPEDTVRTVVHMMESVALPGGGGVKAAIKGYRVAIKTGTAKSRAGWPLHQQIHCLYRRRCACESAALRAGCCYQRSAGG